VLSFESKEGDRDRKPRGGSDDGADLLEGLDKMRELLSGNEPLLVRLQVGEDRREAGAVSLRIEGALSLEAKLSAKAEQLIVRLNAKQCTPQNLEALCKILDENRGKARLRLRINWPGRGEVVLLTAERWRVQVGEQLIGAVEKVFGRGSAMAG
jgi:hypothetical protein